MNASPGAPRAAGRAVLLGSAFALVAAVNAVRWLRPALLLDSEPSWAIPRLLLGLAVVLAAVTAGGISAACFLLWTRSRSSATPLPPVPFSRTTLAALAAAAFVLGCLARLIHLDVIPEGLWIDDVSMIAPALDLSGRWSDFADSIRPIPFGETPTGTVGVLYLEFFRALFLLFGASTFSLRLPAALAGAASLVTAGLLARRLLPRGGATLTIVVLAGLYWGLVMSRLGWVALVISPIISLATLLLLHAREGPRPVLSFFAGALMGIGAHVYLAAWVGAAGLLAVACWPPAAPASFARRSRLVLPAFFVFGLLLAASPLFLFRSGRTVPYFVRTRHQNVIHEVRNARSPLPVFEAAADGVSAPWLASSARGWPENVQLGFVFRALLAVAFLRALARPRDDLSMVLLAQAGAALAATVVGGPRAVPNGFRFAYLSEMTAVAIAAGALWTLSLARRADRRLLAMAMIGLLGAGSLLKARDFFLHFSVRPGRDASSEATLVGRSAARWERYGSVLVEPRLIRFEGMAATIRKHRLDPGTPPGAGPAPAARSFRIVGPATPPARGERAVEIVRGPDWTCAVVLGTKVR